MTEQISGLCSYMETNHEILTVKNMNAPDALIFARLCNFKFENTFPDEYGEITISVSEFAVVMLEEERSKDETQFLEILTWSPRYQMCTISSMAAENQYSQWAAFTVHTNDDSGAVIIAMRGTDATVLGWTEDLLLGYDIDGTEAQKLSADYIDRCAAPAIILTGHSKGGNDVVSGFCMASQAVRDRVLCIYNFDGPGVNNEFMQRYALGYAELQDKLISFYPQDSIIGKLLNNHPGKEQYVAATVRNVYHNKGLLGEHDPFSWAVQGKHFVEAQQTPLSKWLDESMDDTLSKLSNEERKDVVSVLLKYGVPSLIIGKDENSFADNKRAAMEALDYIDKHGIVPRKFKEKAAVKAVKPFIDFFDAILVWHKLTPEEKHASEKVAALFILYGLYESGERKISEVIDGYYRVAGWIYDKHRELSDAIHEFGNLVEEKLYEALACDTVSHTVRCEECEKMMELSKELRKYYTDICHVQNRLNGLDYLSDFSKIQKIKQQVIAMAVACDWRRTGQVRTSDSPII